MDRFASKASNIERINEINDMGQGCKIKEINDLSQSSKIHEINSLITNNKTVCFEGNTNNMSADVLSLFTFYNNEEEPEGNSKVMEQNLAEKVKILMQEPSSKIFKNVGIYKLKTSSLIKYFEIYFRKFSFKNKTSSNDIMIYDVTELITSKEKIVEESEINKKIQTKILNEFKIPVNSIIEIIGGIEDSISPIIPKANQSRLKGLNTVVSLSNYLIFQISDKIDFTNINSLKEININLEKINLREIVNFVFEILNSLLICKKVDNEEIKPILEFDNEIDNLHIKADVVRLKQILINLVSNAVKFKTTGCLKLKCSIDHNKECVMVVLSNLGTGMLEKEKSLEDSNTLKNDIINTAIERRPDISTCKSLASSMNLTLDSFFYSDQAIEFSLAFPILQDSQLNKSIITQIIDEDPEDIESKNEIRMNELKLLSYDKSYTTEKRIVPEIDLENQENSNSRIKLKTYKHDSDDSKNLKDKFLGGNFKTNLNIPKNIISGVNINDSEIESKQIQINYDISLKKKGKILIVGAHRFTREVTKNILKKIIHEAGSDLEIILGSDGSDIIHHVINEESKGDEIKCVITDENMKYLNGSEATLIIRNLKKLEKIKFVNIISVTDNEDPTNTNQIIKTGAQLVLSKPLQKSVISRILKDLKII